MLVSSSIEVGACSFEVFAEVKKSFVIVAQGRSCGPSRKGVMVAVTVSLVGPWGASVS